MITASNETVEVTATDGERVTLTAYGDTSGAVLTPDEARQISVRLLQAADLADPECATRYTAMGRY